MASPEEVQVTARETEFIQVAKDGPVDWLTLNRPEQLNAITPAMAAELSDYFRSIAPSEQTRIVVIRGAGRAFCAGLDIVAASSGDTMTRSPDASPDRMMTCRLSARRTSISRNSSRSSPFTTRR